MLHNEFSSPFTSTTLKSQTCLDNFHPTAVESESSEKRTLALKQNTFLGSNGATGCGLSALLFNFKFENQLVLDRIAPQNGGPNVTK